MIIGDDAYNSILSGSLKDCLKTMITNEPSNEIKDYCIRLASFNGNYEVVRYLISLGGDIETEHGYCLYWASVRGYPDIVKLLLEYGAEFTFGTFNTVVADALKIVNKRNHMAVIRHLINAGSEYRTQFILELLGIDRYPDTREEMLLAIDMAIVSTE